MKSRLSQIVLAIASAVVAMPAMAQTTVVRLSHPLPPDHHMAQLLELFAADVAAASKGKVTVELLGAEKAFKAGQNASAVQKHAVDAAAVTNFQWGSVVPEMNVMSVPYFMTGLDRIQRFPGSNAAKLLETKLEAQGVKNIAWLYDSRFAIFTSNTKPLRAPEDFKGVKIRGLSALVDTGLQAAGAAPVEMAAADAYAALQSGSMQAAVTDVSAAYSRRFYEVQKYGTVSPFFVVYFNVFVNPAWWKSLPEDARHAIEEAAQKAEHNAVALTEKTAKRSIAQLREKGMDVVVQNDEQAQRFQRVMAPSALAQFQKSSADASRLVREIEGLSTH